MKVWFMYDNHTFSKVPGIETAPRELVEAHIRALFLENGRGTLFARNARDETVAHLHGHPFGEIGKSPWGVYPVEIESFLDKVEEHMNWEAR
jgi:hypothetical protein